MHLPTPPNKCLTVLVQQSLERLAKHFDEVGRLKRATPINVTDDAKPMAIAPRVGHSGTIAPKLLHKSQRYPRPASQVYAFTSVILFTKPGSPYSVRLAVI